MTQTNSNAQPQERLWTPDFIKIILINFFVFLNHLMILSTFPFFVSYLGYSDSISGACATLFSFVAVICRPFIGWMLDNGKRKLILLIGICGMALMPMGYLLIYTTLASLALVFISRMLHGCAFGGIEPALQAMAVSIAPPDRRGAANSTFLCAYDIGIGLGGGLAGVLIDAVGYHSMFTVISVAAILAVMIYVAWGRKHPSSITWRLKHER